MDKTKSRLDLHEIAKQKATKYAKQFAKGRKFGTLKDYAREDFIEGFLAGLETVSEIYHVGKQKSASND